MKKIHVLLPDPRPKLAEGKKQKTWLKWKRKRWEKRRRRYAQKKEKEENGKWMHMTLQDTRKQKKNTHRCTRTHTHLTSINYSLHLMSNEGKIHLPINSFILIIRTHKSKDGAASWSTLHTFTIYTLIFIYIHIYSYLHIHLMYFSIYISPVYLSIYL